MCVHRHTVKGDIIPPGVSVISHSKPFGNSASSDITNGRVHLAVRRIDQSTSLPSGLGGGQWIYRVIHLGGHARM